MLHMWRYGGLFVTCEDYIFMGTTSDQAPVGGAVRARGCLHVYEGVVTIVSHYYCGSSLQQKIGSNGEN